MEYREISGMAEKIRGNIEKVMIGQTKTIDLVLTALFSGGHVLLQDVPGTGKTTLAKALAASLDGTFRRIQFTPDLLPSDITGTRIFHQKEGTFEFAKGPVFTNILLTDEINRATPRTQSALLECMEEHQVTEGGETYPLPAPFFVIATQNPIESQGTFPLPEAQTDRFLMQLKPGYPDTQQAVQMLERFLSENPLELLNPAAKLDDVQEAIRLCRTCYVQPDILQYLAKLAEAARDPQTVLLGPSPRAMLALVHASQALAAIRGRSFVLPDDVKELIIPVWAHRMMMRGYADQNRPEDFLHSLCEKVPAPTEVRS